LSSGAPYAALLVLVLGVAGCPVTDAYFVDQDRGMPGLGGEGAGAGSGNEPGAGKAPVAGTPAGGSLNPQGGAAAEPSTAGVSPGEGGGRAEPCTPMTERCNGHDDNCNDVVDEQACNSLPVGTMGCAGFIVARDPNHGYMLCSGVTRDYAHAQEACQGQGMRLAWLESRDENAAVSAKVAAIEPSGDVWIGANDIADEGVWSWDGPGGSLFWGGNEYGNPVGDAFTAWSEASPNNSEQGNPQGEDCAVLVASKANWADRSCSVKYAYLCEEP
jgi:hypothetical protein